MQISTNLLPAGAGLRTVQWRRLSRDCLKQASCFKHHIFYTSHHGYHLGQFGCGKLFLLTFVRPWKKIIFWPRMICPYTRGSQVSVECKKQWYQAPCSLAQKLVCRVREGMSLFGQLQRLTHNSQLFIVMDNTTSGEIITS